MIQLYQKINILKVLSHFFRDPFNGYYLRELARELQMDPMTVKRSLDLLVEDGFIERYREKNMVLYRGMIKNPHFTFAKVSYNLSVIYDSKLVDGIVDENDVICIVLYGSVARGDDDLNSDLDLLILTNSRVGRIQCQKDLPWDLSPTVMTTGMWTREAERNRPFYDEVRSEGVVLFGSIPVIE